MSARKTRRPPRPVARPSPAPAPPPPPTFAESLRRMDLVWVGALALLVRLVWLWINVEDPLFTVPLVDAAEHHEHSGHILGHLVNPDFSYRAYFRAPGYAWLLAGLRYVTNFDFFGIYLLQHVLGAGLAVACYALGRRLWSPVAGVVAAAIVAFYGPQLFYEQRLLPPVWAQWLVLGAFVALYALLRNPALGRTRAVLWASACGVFLGLGALLRPNLQAALLGAVLLVFFTVKPRWVSAVVLLAGMLAISPVTLTNLSREPGLVPIAYGSGVNLYLSNGPERLARLAIRPGYEWREMMDLPKREIPAERYTSAAHSAWFTRKALSEMAANPLDTAGKLAWHTLAFLSPLEVSRDEPVRYHLRRLGVESWVLGYHVPSLFSLMGLVWLWGRRREESLALGALIGSYVAASALYFMLTRYRLPLLPLVALSAGAAAHLLVFERAWLLSHRRYAVAGLAAAAGIWLFSIVFPPNYDLDDRTGRLALARVHALVGADLVRAEALLAALPSPDAEEAFQRDYFRAAQDPHSDFTASFVASLQTSGASPDWRFETAEMLGTHGNRVLASSLLNGLLHTPNYAAPAAGLLSDWLAQKGRNAECLDVVERGFRDNPNLPALHKSAARCAAFMGDFDRARRHLWVLSVMEPQNGRYDWQRAMVERMAGDEAEARAWMNKARQKGFVLPPDEGGGN